MNRLQRSVKMSCNPAILISLLLLLLSLLNHWQYAVTTPTTDFFTCWGIQLAYRSNPVENIYNAEDQRTLASVLIKKIEPWKSSKKLQVAEDLTSRFYDHRIGASGSPLLYALVGILSTGDYEKDQRNFTALCFLCFLAAMLLLCYLLKYPPLSAILLVIFFSSLYAPVLSDMEVGNINQIQLLIISLFILFAARSKPLWTGIAIGMGIMLKPNISLIWLFFNIALLIDRKYRYQIFHLLGTAAGILLAAVLPVIYFGKPGIWVQFFKSLPTLGGFSFPIQNGNYGLPVLVFELTGVRLAIVIGAVLVLAFTCVIILTRSKASPGVGNSTSLGDGSLHKSFTIAGTGIAVTLLSGNLAWLHYYILLIPLVIYLLRPGSDENRRPHFMQTAVQLATIAALLLFSTAMPEILNNALSQAVAVNIGTALLMLSALYELWSFREWSRAG